MPALSPPHVPATSVMCVYVAAEQARRAEIESGATICVARTRNAKDREAPLAVVMLGILSLKFPAHCDSTCRTDMPGEERSLRPTVSQRSVTPAVVHSCRNR